MTEDLDHIFAQWAQEKLRKDFRRPKYNTLVAVDTKDLSINKDNETYHQENEEDAKGVVSITTDEEVLNNDTDTVMEHEITAGDTTKSSCKWSQTKGYRLSASVAVNVGLPTITGLTAKAGVQFQLFKTKTETRDEEESHGHQTKVNVQPWSKVRVSIETKKKVNKMAFSLSVYLQGKVAVKMRQESGKTKIATGDVVDIIQNYGKNTSLEIDTDPGGKRRVRLIIEGTFERMTTIDRKVNTTVLTTKLDRDEDAFKTSVKNYYEANLAKFKPLNWIDDFSLTYTDIFTELELVQVHNKQVKTTNMTAQSEKRLILNSFDRFIKNDFTNRYGRSLASRCIILIESEAGGGKTTFLSKEALDATLKKTELGRWHDIVLLIRLREVREGTTIEEMVWDQCVPETAGVDVQSIRAILQRNESRVLFLLDGYDELRPNASAKEQAIPKLLSGKTYPNSTIVITSRPSAGVQQFAQPDGQLRIRGFSPKHVKEYVGKYFANTPDLASELVTTLSQSQTLTELTRTPIFLTMICLLWEENRQMMSTGTMTGLYNNLLTCLWRKHCRREGQAMPTDGLPEDLNHALLQLGKLATEALLRNETLIDLADVQRATESWNLLLDLGIVSLETSASRLSPRKQLSFSHKTMQEFLSGRYVAHAFGNLGHFAIDQQLSSITKALENSNLLQFTCGCNSSVAKAELDLSWNFGLRGKDGMAVLKDGLSSVPKLTVLRLQGSDLMGEGMSSLAPCMRNLAGLKGLDVSHNRIGDTGLWYLTDYLDRFKALEMLDLSGTGIIHIGTLVQALYDLEELQCLDVSSNEIKVSEIVSLIETLCKSPTTAPRCSTTLKVLFIGHNKEMTIANMGGLVTKLISTLALPALTWLDMSGCGTPLHGDAAEALAQALPSLPALEWLNLTGQKLDRAGFEAVVQAAEEHPTLKSIWYDTELLPDGADTSASCLHWSRCDDSDD
ncbi:NLRC4 [Branchiostoma lanceolatum]|uniref:NLRC4 protein n=1 Tax=Branchiostoma lanceolatum TaxID=7740 RepID=A0A8J9Z727_BRALA|nr:NLRC4 [Branchiostoma lanceolatum]